MRHLIHLCFLGSNILHLTSSNKVFGQHGQLWQRDICSGSEPAGTKVIADHSKIDCDNNDELVVVHEPRNVPVIKYHEVEGVAKREFYDSQEQLHIAECYTDFGLPAPQIRAKIRLQNGTTLYEEFDISACLGRSSKNFLSFSTDSIFSDFNENTDCRTDFDYLNSEETDYVKRSTGILFKVIDEHFDKAKISCQNSYYLNGTNGKMATSESSEIEIRVYRPMQSVKLDVEQDPISGAILKLNCEAFGGYPENYQFFYELNGKNLDISDILSSNLNAGDELICSAIWSVGDQSKTMRSDTFLSIFQRMSEIGMSESGPQGGGAGFEVLGDGVVVEKDDYDEGVEDENPTGNKTMKMLLFGLVVVIIIAIVVVFVRIQGWIPGFGSSTSSTEDTEAHGGADGDEQAKEPLNPVQTND